MTYICDFQSNRITKCVLSTNRKCVDRPRESLVFVIILELLEYVSIIKKRYCALWSETSAGRTGHNMASAYIKILKASLQDYPEAEMIVIWSDSCAAQSRNSIQSFALIHLIHKHGNFKIIEQKYSTPGHSLLQEIDAIHSSIERYLRNLEIVRHGGLIRLLKQMDFKNVYLNFIQMKAEHFYDFKSSSSGINFSAIPFSKVKHIIYNINNLYMMKHRNDFSAEFVETTTRS